MTARLRFDNFWLAAVFSALGLGIVLDREPKVALAAVTLVAVAALAAQVARLPVTLIFAGAVVMSSALVDLPGKAQFDGSTANAGLTIAYAFFGALIVTQWPRSTPRETASTLRPFLALLILGLFSIGWGEQSIGAIQNVLVLFVFIVCVLCGIEVAVREPVPGRFAEKAFGAGSIVALALYGGSVAAGGLGSGAVIGNRSFALFALLVIAWGTSGWRYRGRFGRTLTLLGGLLIVLSLSRIAFAAALVVCCFVWLNPRTSRGWFRFISVVSVAVAISYATIEHVRPLHDRVYAGDVQAIGGGVSINVTGRSEFWETTWDSYLTSPFIGHGVGSADALISRVYSESVGHPHNDYLRLLHDYGLLGMCLWVIGYGWLMQRTWRSWQRPHASAESGQAPVIRDERRIHAAAFLSLIAVAIAMITDNPITYLFVMGPLGVLAGLSLGVEARPVEAGAQVERFNWHRSRDAC